MKPSSSLCLFLSFLSIQFYVSCQPTDLEINQDLKSLLEENRRLKESMKVLEEKFEEKFEKFEEKLEKFDEKRCLRNFQPSANGIPTSCADLSRGGETVSGLYQVKPNGGSAIVTVYCDMSKLPDETGLETFIGTSDVKSSLVYFTSTYSGSFNTTRGIIPFNMISLNIGNAMNIASHQFTAPVKGIYFFSLTILSRTRASASILRKIPPSSGIIFVEAKVNSDGIVYQQASVQATLEINAGDSVFAYLEEGAIESPYGQNTVFTGYLLQELV